MDLRCNTRAWQAHSSYAFRSLRCSNLHADVVRRSAIMTKAAFFGYLFLSCGPPLAVGLPFFWHRAFLSLTVITSMFAWLFVMIVTSMLFRGFVPLRSDVGPYAGMLVLTVLLEELARVGLWFVHTFSSKKLRELAHTGYVRYDDQDELSLAYSIGWGHGFLHLLMQFLPFLFLTWNTPTVYTTECTQMSAFLLSCLSQLGFFAILAGAAPETSSLRFAFVLGCLITSSVDQRIQVRGSSCVASTQAGAT